MVDKVFITDIDGCMLRIPFEEYFGLVYGRPGLTPSLHWNFDEGFGVSKAEGNRVWEHIWKPPFFARPFPGAHEFVKTLQKKGIKVIGCSARTAGEAQAASVRDCQPLGLDGLFFAEHRSHKPAVLQQIVSGNEFVGLLEDNIQNAIEAAECLDTKKVFLISRPYNSSHDLCGYYKRVDSYRQILVALGIESPTYVEVAADQYAPFSGLRVAENFCKRS